MFEALTGIVFVVVAVVVLAAVLGLVLSLLGLFVGLAALLIKLAFIGGLIYLLWIVIRGVARAV